MKHKTLDLSTELITNKGKLTTIKRLKAFNLFKKTVVKRY